MTRGKRKRKNSQPPQSAKPATQQWSTGELKTILVEAILEAEHRKEQEWNQRKKEERKEWARIMGEEDLSQYKGVQRLWKEIVSSFKILYHIVFFKRGMIESFYVENFVKSMTMVIFRLIEIALYFVIIYMGVVAWSSVNAIDLNQMTSSQNFYRIGIVALCIITCILIFVISRYFHNMVYEVSNMEDQSLLFSLFAVLIAFVSLIFSILTFVKGG